MSEIEKRLEDLERRMGNMDAGFAKKYSIISKDVVYSSNPAEAMYRFLDSVMFNTLYSIHGDGDYPDGTELSDECKTMLNELEDLLDAEEVKQM